MNEMMAGIVFFFIGVLMMLFHRPIGIGFCRIGKGIWNNTKMPIARDMGKDMVKLYDETKAPRIMLLMGIVFAVEGIFFWLFPAFTR